MKKNEKRILSSIKDRLERDYGYPVSLIKEDYLLSKKGHFADLVVFKSTKKDKILIVVEIELGDLLIPLGSAQLQKNMRFVNSKYGILTNGSVYLFFENIGGEFVQIADLPPKQKSKKQIELKPIPNPSNFIWQLFNQSRSYDLMSTAFDY
jgi:hypothetical protein